MPTYKDLYEELQEAISAAITMLQQIQQDTKDTYVTEEKKEMRIYHYHDEDECHPDK